MTIEPIANFELPVAEHLTIARTRFGQADPSEPAQPRLAVVTGTHGEELQGLLVCALLAKRLSQLEATGQIIGLIDLYPSLNPIAIDTASRSMPVFDTDLNVAFGLDSRGDKSFVKELGRSISESLKGADLVIHLHSANPFLEELPHARINVTFRSQLLPWAEALGLDFAQIHADVAGLQNSLSYILNNQNTPCLVVETGFGALIDPPSADSLAKAILNAAVRLKVIGDWPQPGQRRHPRLSSDGTMHTLYATHAGLFVPSAAVGTSVVDGQELGIVLAPDTGAVRETIVAPVRGLVVGRRKHPVVQGGSLVVRLYEGPGAVDIAALDAGGPN